MSSIVGSLRVMLGMDSAAFEKGLTKTQKQMKKFQRQMERTGKNLQRTGRSLSLRITAPLAGFTAAAVRSSLKTIDAQAKMAQSMDTTVRSIQNLTRAGDLAGISQGDLEGSLRRMTRRISLAEQGMGPATKAFDRLGISAADLAGLPVDERVRKINTAISNLIPEAEQAGVASQIFGDQTGLAMQRLDAETLAQATEEVGRFGVGVSEVDAEKIEQANDAISGIGSAVQGIANQITVAFAPVLESIAEKLQNWAIKFSELEPEVKKIIVVGGSLAAALGPVLLAIGGIVLVVKPLVAIMAALASPFVAVGAAAALAGYLIYKNWDTIKEAVSRAVKAVGEFIDGALEDLRALGPRMMKALRDVAREIWDGAKEIGSQIIEGIRQGLEEKWQGLKDRVSGIGTGITDTFKDVLGIRSPSRVFAEAGKNIVGGLIKGLSGALPQLEGVMKRIGGSVAGSKGFSGSLNKIGTALGDVITKTRSWGDVLRDTLSTWQRAMQSSATSSLAGMMPGGSGGFLGGLVSSVFGGLKLFAKGGVVSSPTAFPMRGGLGVMGEAGPEAIMPLQRGRGGALGVMAQMQPVRVIVEASEDLRVTAAQAGQGAAVEVVTRNNRALGEMRRRGR